ncbi:immunity 49 family protein [Streptomyces sp. MAR25Y5]|nr:Imm49 family immunity protein [Streptomyces sp. MAR25Y5]MCP3770953.1 immunity 49 family protein [Streptomyces sp. MAR25Y5]
MPRKRAGEVRHPGPPAGAVRPNSGSGTAEQGEHTSRRGPRSLLPQEIIALAALAVQVHGWDLRVRSACLPSALLDAPEDAFRGIG